MIYTKTGDNGTTSLVDGSRISKDDIRVECYGTVDELNAHIGMLREMTQAIDNPSVTCYCQQLAAIQNELFVIQTLLATAEESVVAQLPQLPESAVFALEKWIDEITELLPPIHAFVIPGGSIAAAQGHISRCVCRRAERLIVSLSHTADTSMSIHKYINRLSDYLFVLSRRLIMLENKTENFWHAT